MTVAAQIHILEKNDEVTRIQEHLVSIKKIYGIEWGAKILELENRTLIVRELRPLEYKVLFEINHKFEKMWFVSGKSNVFIFFSDRSENGQSTIIRVNDLGVSAIVSSSSGRIVTAVKDEFYLIHEEQIKVLRISDGRLFRLDSAINFVHMVEPTLFVVRYKLHNDYAVGGLTIDNEVRSSWIYKAGENEVISFTRLIKQYVAVLIKKTAKEEVSSEGRLIFLDPKTGETVFGILGVTWIEECDGYYEVQTKVGRFNLHSDFSLERIN